MWIDSASLINAGQHSKILPKCKYYILEYSFISHCGETKTNYCKKISKDGKYFNVKQNINIMVTFLKKSKLLG